MPSLRSALAILSSKVLINSTIDAELSSLVDLTIIYITITGHNNSTVDCNNSEGMHFISCYNRTIEGIT